MRRVAALAVALAVGGAPQAPPPARAADSSDPPNVLVIVTDDQRADEMRVLKDTLRWFAQEGTQFPNTYATTPLCCPSRASILSGRYAHNTRVETNVEGERLEPRSTIQRYLQEDGYRTAMVGKYLNTYQGNPPYFDEWAVFPPSEGGYRNTEFNVNGQLRVVKRYSTAYIGSYARNLLKGFEADDATPWFLYVAPFAPHAPYEPARKYQKARVPKFKRNPAVRETDRTDKPPWVQAKSTSIKDSRAIWTKQLRMLKSVDDLVDGLLTTMGTLGERNQTIAFFISDNGFMLSEHGLRQKHTPYTASVQIPLLARWPGHLTPGAVDARPAGNIDIAPTILDATGITADDEFPMDGRSLLAPNEREHVLLEYTHREDRAVPTWASIRTPTYQYTELYDEDLQTVIFREYYDMVADPWQLTNLLGDGDPSNDPPPEVLAQLSIALAKDRRCEGTDGASACP